MTTDADTTGASGRGVRDPAAIEVRDLWLSFGGHYVLEAVDLTVHEGEFFGLIGPNGAGKSVLLKVLLGLLRADRGSVRILGKPPGASRGDIAYVPQRAEFDTRFPIHVMDVVLMGRLGRARMLRPYGAEDRARAHQALERVGMLDLARRQIGELSGGQLQRVLIARALVLDARVLLLDEPTANLDSTVAGRLYELLRDLTGKLTIVLVDHDIGVMSRYVQSVGCLNRRLHHHHGKHLPQEVLEEAYGYPVEVLTHHRHDDHGHDHGHDHRVLGGHENDDS
jgi:zinc transport system ATP-binding protein